MWTYDSQTISFYSISTHTSVYPCCTVLECCACLFINPHLTAIRWHQTSMWVVFVFVELWTQLCACPAVLKAPLKPGKWYYSINAHFNRHSTIIILCGSGQKTSHVHADILCSDTLCNRSIQTHADPCIRSCPDTRARTDFALTPHVLNKYHNTDMSPYSHTIKTGLTYNSLILILNPSRFSWYADIT